MPLFENQRPMQDLLTFSSAQSPPQPQPWVQTLFQHIQLLLQLQPTVTIHRSKLFALFDDFRSLLRTFVPDPSLDPQTAQNTCQQFIETLGRIKQIVFNCSSQAWTTAAVTWPHNTCKDSIIRVRAEISRCVAHFGCRAATEFILTDSLIEAQDSADILGLKGSLIDYQTNLKTQPQAQTPQVQNVINMIDERVRSIGPIEGIPDGPGISVIPPFLPSNLDLELTHSEFSLGEMIGNGTFGCVYVGTMNHSMKKVAIKVLHMKVLGGRQLETFKREVWTMATVNHPALLHLLGVTLKPPFCIITELLKSSLFDRMRYLTPTRRAVVAHHVALGMAQLHASRIIHRDLKSANILLDEDDLPRVCDFGLVGFNKKGVHTGFVGTAQWMAPELLRSSPFYDEKVDVYSFAVLLWELLTLQEPYKGMTQDQVVMGVIERGIRPALPSHFGPPGLVQLIQQCWAENPAERPSFEYISAALRTPECHFIGTNEEEFDRFVPKQKLSEDIKHAFDSSNWRRLDQLFGEISPSACESDPELMSTVMSMFENLDSERQRAVVSLLPRMVDFEQFLCMKGYRFVLSLFSKTETVIDETISTLRTLGLGSKAFRQAKLMRALIRSRNRNALSLVVDLCTCEDVGVYVTNNYIPLNFEPEFAQYALMIYGSLLGHAQNRSVLSSQEEPLDLAISKIQEFPAEASTVLALYPFSENHAHLIVQVQLIPTLARLSQTEVRALSAIHHIFVLIPSSYLAQYAQIITWLLKNHHQFYQNEPLIEKLAAIPGVTVERPAVQPPTLIDF